MTQGVHESPPPAAAPSSAVARHWQSRKTYRSTADWIWSLYNRARSRAPGRFLPGKGCIRPVGGGDFDITTIFESSWNTVLLLHSRSDAVR
jgi:hypothetical protein